jgi:hypothetical protein
MQDYDQNICEYRPWACTEKTIYELLTVIILVGEPYGKIGLRLYF